MLKISIISRGRDFDSSHDKNLDRFVIVFLAMTPKSHCERSEAIHAFLELNFWIVTVGSKPRPSLAMTKSGSLRHYIPRDDG